MSADMLPWWGWLLASFGLGTVAFLLAQVWFVRPNWFWTCLAVVAALYLSAGLCLVIGLVRLAKWAWAP